ncbi:MAG: hypothetical protein P9L92_13685 [Candidatus Electryonea clarkiae]|nr:hypothetical protein [Candidatus Electryonea clarkiae]MDP8289208.1 hypothetical protein [Candidatus Electryonea clarkiae]
MKTHIVLRISGFYAKIERMLLPPNEKRPVAVVTGEGARAMVLSVTDDAKRMGVYPNNRVDTLDNKELLQIQSDPNRYKYMIDEILCELGMFLTEPELLRPGFFAATWSSGTRFLKETLKKINIRLRIRGFSGSWGIASEKSVAEIASMIAGTGEILFVASKDISAFLKSLPIEVLHDLNKKQCETLHQVSVRTLGEIAKLPDILLRELFGSEGRTLKTLAFCGQRPEPKREWRGRRRLSGDEDDPGEVHKALATLVSEGMDALSVAGYEPFSLRLMILYSDGKRSGGLVKRNGIRHEGAWQRAAFELTNQLWQRRVRLAELRMTIPFGNPPGRQLKLFEPALLTGRDERLQRTLYNLRMRWGKNSVKFASAWEKSTV